MSDLLNHSRFTASIRVRHHLSLRLQFGIYYKKLCSRPFQQSDRIRPKIAISVFKSNHHYTGAMEIQEMTMGSLVKQALESHPELHRTREIHLTTPFHAIIICYDPHYISDGEICIQAIFPDFMKVWEHAKPINSARTPFYNTFKDGVRVFNCPVEMLEQIPQKYPSAYHPAFHFKGREEEYKKEGLAIKLPKDIKEMLYVKQWSIHIVNIGNTSFFAPIIKISSYESVRKIKSSLLEIPTSILYQPYIEKIMQRTRVGELREYYRSNPIPNKFSISKEYPTQISASSNNSRLSFLDAHNSKLKSPAATSSEDVAYIYVGEKPKKNSFYHFKKPLGNTYKSIDVTDIRRHDNFYDRLIPLNQQDQEQPEEPPYLQLLNDSNDSSNDNRKQDDNSDKDSQSSDPLRKLYKRMLVEDNKSNNA